MNIGHSQLIILKGIDAFNKQEITDEKAKLLDEKTTAEHILAISCVHIKEEKIVELKTVFDNSRFFITITLLCHLIPIGLENFGTDM